MSNLASTLVPSFGTGPGLTGLGGNWGKYIYELHWIFIANNFLIYGMPVVDGDLIGSASNLEQAL